MSMTDPLADLLTRIRNGISSKKHFVEMPSSNLKVEIVKILKDEGYITNFKVMEDNKQGILRVDLKYDEEGAAAITDLQRVSRPGLRKYCGYRDIKPILGGLGISILSTSNGLMTDRAARKECAGGEVLCTVW